MTDAIEILLEGRPHPTAQKLLAFHRANKTFFLEFAAEFFWLKKRGRPGAAKALLMFFRGAKRWTGVDEFMINDHIFPASASCSTRRSTMRRWKFASARRTIFSELMLCRGAGKRKAWCSAQEKQRAWSLPNCRPRPPRRCS